MCRHVGYLGTPVTLHSLMYEGEHSLERQSYAPRMTQGNLLNADGFGVGWYHAGEAVRFRRAQPIWTDQSFREVARVVTSGCAVAAIRSATVGFPVDESGAQPFRDGPRLFSHNGVVEGFAGVEAKLRELAGDLSPVPDARAAVDSALLFAIAARHWRGGASLAEGLAAVVRTVTALAPGRYNLLAADGTALAATTWGDCLHVRASPDAVTLSSEPLDGSGWQAVPDRSLVTADPASGVRVTPL
ncbi:gamma-glutamyl-hercynylcysteine sulfoxide hydrolase [Actinomadura sp. NBRC 104425]|uniref:ergothioneine biosynthesis protein EgtC n=1 Tax=Actinomadura sp. NBRC 104425 TaxID=3032204 RepID=UPI0024A39285|nr:ergothioneine biosynthesis protein EgtC [Actinomadura sp. NBRC 104425]GLZ14717.1 gamma-glutamyl-hercynylcysteine sulfoxide hydrolase [Actinomadura sp. NBRC 104425]